MVDKKLGKMVENKKPIRGFGALDTPKKKALFLQIFEKKLCNISEACKAIPIGRRTYYRWIEEDDEFKKKIEDLQEGLIDWAESQLQKSIKAGQYVPTIFFLKTKGRSRGYIEKTEHEHSGSVKFEVSDEFLPGKPKP